LNTVSLLRHAAKVLLRVLRNRVEAKVDGIKRSLGSEEEWEQGAQ